MCNILLENQKEKTQVDNCVLVLVKIALSKKKRA